MSQEAKRTAEFRRYRQILTGIYLTAAGSIFLLLTISVVEELFFRRSSSPVTESRMSADRPEPTELLECHQLVLGLLTTLGNETARLLALPARGDRGELASRWEDFSRIWRDEWDVAEARCRFSELAHTQLGDAFDRLAKVHGDLPSMRLKYQSLLVRFDEEQSTELADMRRSLDVSRTAFVKMARDLDRVSPPRGR